MIQAPQIKFPFVQADVTLDIPRQWASWWTDKGVQLPLSVHVDPRGVRVGASAYNLYPQADGGFIVQRKGGLTPVGVIYQYGVRQSLSSVFFQELSAIRAVLFGKTYPAVLAYEMRDRTKVHPGPCFDMHPCTTIKKAQYKLGNSEDVCCICKERFL